MHHPISQQSYGKCSIRLTKVSRASERHSIRELKVDVELDGDFEAAYTAADNRLVVPTDTMKNTVYALAKQNDFSSIESFGHILAQHFVSTFDHVVCAMVHLREHAWRRMLVAGEKHRHAFVDDGNERCTATVTIDQGVLKIRSGLDGLAVLKTTGSGFSDFYKDQYTTLQDTPDRIFATAITAEWICEGKNTDWTECRQAIRQRLLEVFATHDSKSVQHTLYAMANEVLNHCPTVQSITICMPNEHRLLVDLEPFGLDNDNEIFTPTSEPYGMIRATIERGGESV